MKLYRFFLPKYYNDGKEIAAITYKNILDQIAKKFGAYTLNPNVALPLMEGVWKSDKTNKYYTDKNYCLELFTQDTFDNCKWLKSFSEIVRQELKQEDLFVMVQNAEIITNL